MRWRKTASVVAALVVAAGPALAAINSTASLTNIRLELVDLTPGDGVDPWALYTGGARATAKVYGAPFCFGVCMIDGGPIGEPAVASISKDGGSAFAAYSPTGMFAGGSATPGEGMAGRYMGSSWLKSGGGNPLFKLGANTGVRITGDYSVTATAMNASGSPELAGAYVFGYGALAGGYTNKFVRASSDGSDGPTFAHEAGSFSMMFSNDKARTVGAWGGLDVGAFGRAAVAPVPEPGTYALFAAGLGVVGVVARRRASKDA